MNQRSDHPRSGGNDRRRGSGRPAQGGGRGQGGQGGRRQGPPARRTREKVVRGESLVGQRFEVEVGNVAHGGFCVARHEGRAVFVRHAIPGERVVVEVTDGGSEDRFLRADAVEVLEASPHRVTPPCPYAGPGRCGGCDWQHVEPAHQRVLKADVVREQLDRLAGLEIAEDGLVVEPVPGDVDGLRWRTRLELAVDDEGRPGLRAHRSRTVIPVEDCLVATEAIARSEAFTTEWTGCDAVVVADATEPADAVVVPVPAGRRATPVTVLEEVVLGEPDDDEAWGQEYEVAVDGFWQAHRGAPRTLVETVLDLAQVEEGLDVLDLYCGVGLFTAALADAVGEKGSVLGVEGDQRGAENAQANLEGRDWVEIVHGDVATVLGDLVRNGDHADLVVLDPPRSGAGRAIVEAIVDLEPGAVVYVACDPSALARDVAICEEFGYRLVDLRALDTFPMTQHVECVALLVPADDDEGFADDASEN